MCIAVIDLTQCDQRLHITQLSNDILIHLIDVSASEFAGRLGENTVLVDQIQCAYIIECTDIKIVDTMVRCCVHRPSTGLDGYVLT